MIEERELGSLKKRIEVFRGGGNEVSRNPDSEVMFYPAQVQIVVVRVLDGDGPLFP